MDLSIEVTDQPMLLRKLVQSLLIASMLAAGTLLAPTVRAQTMPGTGCPPAVAITGPATIPAAGGAFTWCHAPCNAGPTVLLVGTPTVFPFTLQYCGAIGPCQFCVPIFSVSITCNAAGCFTLPMPSAAHGTQICLQKACFNPCLHVSEGFVVTWC
jgi:hypothetical protein